MNVFSIPNVVFLDGHFPTTKDFSAARNWGRGQLLSGGIMHVS